MVYRLRNTVQHYEWGSSKALVDLYGFDNPGRQPLAELWVGSHPKAPSRLVTGSGEVPLDEYITANPLRALGASAAGEDPKVPDGLPFLFKILCAQTPLSIQVHPSRAQAQAGYAAEQRCGVEESDPRRNYRDRNHKPELICAIGEFWGLRGFRPVAEIRDEFTTVEFNKADPHLSLPESENGLASFFREQLELPEVSRRELIAAAVSLAGGRWHGRPLDRLPQPGDPLARYFWVLRIADAYPGDIGVLAPLVLNVFSLRPGEATFQPAGVLHAYLHGVGAEVMANSDNVLRGGMTPKHIDIAELMRVGRFRSESPQILTGLADHDPVDRGCRLMRYPTPFEEFEFSRVLPAGRCRLRGGSPQVLFCHRGAVRVCPAGRAGAAPADIALAPGEAVFVDAEDETVEIVGDDGAEVFRTRVPV